MRKILCYLWMSPLFVVICVTQALAHFGVVIPSSSMVMDKKAANLTLNISFIHPFAGQGMDMARPRDVIVQSKAGKSSLAASLVQEIFLGHAAWRAEYEIRRPGVYQFVVIPEPYYEAAEDCFIAHYAKTVVGAFGNEADWDRPIGLPVEIVPLLRPFGNYAGNVFQGRVLREGQPVPGATVEVECLNQGQHVAPNPYFETQTVVADANGVFTFGIPWAGWWGFAALIAGDAQMELNGDKKDVELGAVFWLEFMDPMPAH